MIEINVKGIVTKALKKIALGSIADAILLMQSEDMQGIDLKKLDLFNISEIKRPKGGGYEIKFFDRMEALERLLAIASDESDRLSPFYAALENGAKSLGGEL